ncbi:MAG: hypothetical protein LUG95_06855 [Clostridiales bacterium]|nr:hypothetical protein [Clostridiales bacterium]
MAGALGFGAYVLFAWIYDDGYDFSVTVLAYLVLCSAIWALLFMFSASTARYIKSDKKFYKHFLVYRILFALYKTLIVVPCRLVKKD